MTELRNHIVPDCKTGEPVRVPDDVMVEVQGFPCQDFSSMLDYQARLGRKNCITDGSHLSGKIYRSGSENAVATKIAVRTMEDVPRVAKHIPLLACYE